MASKDIEKEFKADLEEAPYCAHMKMVLPISFRIPKNPSRVLDYLYIGSEEDASDLKNLKELGITHVINCAASYCHTGSSFYGSGTKYVQFDAEDDYDYNIMQHYGQVAAFIDDAKKCGGKALIHCIMGINRSGALAVAYLMVHEHIGPISAAERVRKDRCLLSNDSFQRQVIKFARQRGLLHLDSDKLSKDSATK